MRSNGFDTFTDAVHEAHFRAALTRRRYRVRKTTGTKWWITELTSRLA
jgi:hypothetical protein